MEVKASTSSSDDKEMKAYKDQMDEELAWKGKCVIKVIPHICIAHPFCAKFVASLARARARAYWKHGGFVLMLKNGYSSPTSTGTPPFFQVIVINLS